MVLRLGTQELRNRGAEAVDISKDIASLHLKIPSSDVKILEGHKSEVCMCAWSPAGSLLASGSGDSTARIWDIADGPSTSSVNNGLLKVVVLKHLESRTKRNDVTALDWNGDVNAINWDPNGTLLASCSDDCTAKVWSMKQNKYLHNLRGHEKEVYAIKWSPTGPGSSNPNKKLILARGAVYTVAFSHDGEYLASGSSDNCVNIWSVKDGQLVKTYTGKGCVFEVCWNREGNKVAACFANNVVCVLDIRM